MKQRKIPTIVGLLLVGIAVLVFRFAFDRFSPLLSRASTTLMPQNVTFTNVSDTSFTVTWLTSEPATGAIVMDGVASPVYDDRLVISSGSTPNTKQAYVTHSVTIRNAKPETTYTMRILSGGATYTNNGKPYEIRTSRQLTGTGTSLEPAYGQVVTPTEQPAEGALVYFTLEGGQTLSTIVNASGSWVIPLNLARSADLTAYITPSERVDASILIRSNDGETSALTDTLNDNPVPMMTLGKTYDFRKVQAAAQPNLAQTQPPPAVLGTTTSADPTVAITKPARGSAVPSDLPLIQGTGVPGKTVLVVVGVQNPISDTVVIGADGIWRYTPTRPLAAGKQSVTITTEDANNSPKAITHIFEIFKSGTQVLGDATPSATLEPTPTTIEEEPTPTATLSGEPLPQSGNELPTVILLILGAMLLIGGTGMLLF